MLHPVVLLCRTTTIQGIACHDAIHTTTALHNHNARLCMSRYIPYLYCVARLHPRQCRNDSPWFESKSTPMHITTSRTTTAPHDNNPRQHMSWYIPYFYCTARPHQWQYRNYIYRKVSSWSHTSLPSMLIGSAIFPQLTVVPFDHHQSMALWWCSMTIFDHNEHIVYISE